MRCLGRVTDLTSDAIDLATHVSAEADRAIVDAKIVKVASMKLILIRDLLRSVGISS